MKTGSPSSLLPARAAPVSARGGRWGTRHVILRVGLVLAVLYGLFTATGYAWLHFVIKNSRVGYLDVALLRWHKVRSATAAEQFAEARRAWARGSYQAAYLAFVSAVRNDPDNVDGRLEAASFLGAAGAGTQEIVLLEDGLKRAPDDRRLLEQTFGVLTTTGRDRRALELLHDRYAGKLGGPNGAFLRTTEILATLNLEGGAAARALLDRNPDLKSNSEATPTVARVLWEGGDRAEAIDRLAGYVAGHPRVFSASAELAQWQAAGGLVDDALKTAQAARIQYPKLPQAQLLLIEVIASARSSASPEWLQAVEAYVKDFGNQPGALALLANLAGKKGWVGLARSLYEVSAGNQPDLGLMALYYSDALATARRFADAAQVLTDVETQAGDANVGLLREIRRRQVEVAAARGDADGARDYARRLAVLLGDDPDALAVLRRRFEHEGITGAAAELSAASPLAQTSLHP